MITFTICVEERDDDSMTGRELHKDFTWPMVPRVGDAIGVGGNQYQVNEVVHNFDHDPPTIYVRSFWPRHDFEALDRKDPLWKRTFWED